MKHFFYAVYVLFYTGGVFLGGMFIGQFLERVRTSRLKKSKSSPDLSPSRAAGLAFKDPKVAVMRKRD